jgi:cysteine desulfurase/selenocysteine lyase
MLGPTGVGVLYMKRELADKMLPWQGGGDMIESVRFDGYTSNGLPYKFEAGTPNMAGVIAFGKAIEYINAIGLVNLIMHERQITEYVLRRFLETDGIQLYGPQSPANRGAVFAFNYKDLHSHDIGSMLDFYNIAIRAGHHCAQPLMNKLGVISTARASFYLYNSPEEIDILLEALTECERYLKNAVR